MLPVCALAGVEEEEEEEEEEKFIQNRTRARRDGRGASVFCFVCAIYRWCVVCGELDEVCGFLWVSVCIHIERREIEKSERQRQREAQTPVTFVCRLDTASSARWAPAVGLLFYSIGMVKNSSAFFDMACNGVKNKKIDERKGFCDA